MAVNHVFLERDGRLAAASARLLRRGGCQKHGGKKKLQRLGFAAHPSSRPALWPCAVTQNALPQPGLSLWLSALAWCTAAALTVRRLAAASIFGASAGTGGAVAHAAAGRLSGSLFNGILLRGHRILRVRSSASCAFKEADVRPFETLQRSLRKERIPQGQAIRYSIIPSRFECPCPAEPCGAAANS